jgi:hypothetical protein
MSSHSEILAQEILGKANFDHGMTSGVPHRPIKVEVVLAKKKRIRSRGLLNAAWL